MAVKNFNLKQNRTAPMLDTNSPAGEALAKMLGAMPATVEVKQIPIDLLDVNPLQKNYSMNEDELEWLAENIRSNGVMEPIHVNAAVGGRYTIIAGHRRTEASRRAGKLEIPAIVEHLDEDAANIMFDSTNLGQRKKLLPSERASAYFRLETAMQRKGIFGSKSTSLVSEVTGDNARSIQRYKRLMQLVPELMKKVDSGEIGFAVGVKLSFLPESRQEIINDVIEEKRLKNVKLEQIEAITSLSEVNRAGTQQIINILAPKKRVDATPSKDAKISIGKLLFAPYLPQGCTNREAEQIILKWAKQYKGEIT